MSISQMSREEQPSGSTRSLAISYENIFQYNSLHCEAWQNFPAPAGLLSTNEDRNDQA